MNGTLSNQLREAGVLATYQSEELILDAPVGWMTPERLETLKVARDGLLLELRAEIGRRKEMMWDQLVPGRAIPVLVTTAVPRSGHCLGCGDPLPGGMTRCSLCIAAAKEVTAEFTGTLVSTRPRGGCGGDLAEPEHDDPAEIEPHSRGDERDEY